MRSEERKRGGRCEAERKMQGAEVKGGDGGEWKMRLASEVNGGER